MEIRHLKYFIAVAEHLNFSQAARALKMAQPPLSVQIQNLEQELGFSLFDRQNRQIALTPAGRVFLDEARAVIARQIDAVQTAQDAAHGRAGKILLRPTTGAFSEKVTRRIRKFLRKNRGLRLMIAEPGAAPSHERPIDPEDAAITEFSAAELPSEAVVLERAVICVTVPPKHRLAEKTPLLLSDLMGETLLVAPFESRPAAERTLLAALGSAGVKIAVVSSSPEAANRAWQVSLGLGCGVCTSVDRLSLDAKRLPVADLSEEIVTAVICNPHSRAAALPVFLEAIRVE